MKGGAKAWVLAAAFSTRVPLRDREKLKARYARPDD
jgi:hypothetical protein